MSKTNAAPSFDPAAVFASWKPVDVEALIAAQRRNVEALTAANKAAVDGARALAAVQIEFVRGAVDEYATVWSELLAVKDPKVGVAKQAELTKAAYESSLANLRELGEIATKAQFETFEALNSRVIEGFGELQTLAKKA